MTVLVDTREQRPWAFPEGVEVKAATLKQGDYALDGDGTFSVERKSAKDFRGTVAGRSENWDRFVRELHRMDEIGNPHKTIVVEGDISDYLFGATGRGVKEQEVDCDPTLLLSRVAELTVMHRASVLFARDEGVAAALAYHIFCKRLIQLNGRLA